MDILRDITRQKIIVLVVSVILLQLAVITYFFAIEKKGYYADDLYSYGYANSSGKVSPLEDETGVIQTNVWLDSKILVDYLTVSPEEFFLYDTIYTTLKRDAHPPLFYFLLHFICSFTPGVFSKWSAYIINIVGFIILQIYLYRLVLFISKNRFISLLIMTFFGLTSANINMMCLLRMYILATGFIVAFTFYTWNYLFITSEKKIFSNNLLLASVFLFLASMTVYIAILFAFFLSLFVSIVFLVKKQYRQFFAYGFSMFSSVLLMVICFPVFFDQLSLDQPALRGALLYPYMLQLRTGVQVILNPLFGLTISVFPTMTFSYFCFIMIGLLIIYLILMFLFRKDSWFSVLRTKIRLLLVTFMKKSRQYMYTLLPILLPCIAILLISARRLLLYYYHFESIRYLYILTPFITIASLLTILKIIRINSMQFLIIALIIFTSIFFGDKCYLQNENVSLNAREIVKDADVIIVEKSQAAFIYHIAELLDSHMFITTNPKSISQNIINKASFEAFDKNNTILMIDVDVISLEPKQLIQIDSFNGVRKSASSPNNDIIDYFYSEFDYSNIDYIGRTRIAYVYRIKK